MLNRLARWAHRQLPRRTEQGGQALLFVLIALALLMSIPLAIATTTVNQLPQTTRNLNWDAAYEAAQAGLNDYMQHLDANSQYTVDVSNPAYKAWEQASTTPLEYYSYVPSTLAGGLISLEVSGKAGGGSTAVVRTFDYTLRPVSSLDYVYWSNYETLDPSIASLSDGNCGYYYDQTSPEGTNAGPASDCIIVFKTGDVIDGPIFSDDTFRICGAPTFDSQVYSGNIYAPANTVDVNSGCTGFGPNFNGLTPAKVGNQTPPLTINDATPAKNYGCYYNGNVTIALTSPSKGNTNITVSGSGVTVTKNAGNTNSCPVGSSFALSSMTSGLIYVTGQVTISGTMSGLLDVVSGTNILISNNLEYPQSDINFTSETDTTDSLGLIANNSVEVLTVPSSFPNIIIDAAIMAATDSFYVQNWTSAPSLGNLNLFGAIAQNYRGPVGTVGSPGTGYTKSYQYDTSLQSLWPPYFLPPGGAVWNPSTYSELCPGLTYSVMGTKTPGSC